MNKRNALLILKIRVKHQKILEKLILIKNNCNIVTLKGSNVLDLYNYCKETFENVFSDENNITIEINKDLHIEIKNIEEFIEKNNYVSSLAVIQPIQDKETEQIYKLGLNFNKNIDSRKYKDIELLLNEWFDEVLGIRIKKILKGDGYIEINNKKEETNYNNFDRIILLEEILLDKSILKELNSIGIL